MRVFLTSKAHEASFALTFGILSFDVRLLAIWVLLRGNGRLNFWLFILLGSLHYV